MTYHDFAKNANNNNNNNNKNNNTKKPTCLADLLAFGF